MDSERVIFNEEKPTRIASPNTNTGVNFALASMQSLPASEIQMYPSFLINQ